MADVLVKGLTKWFKGGDGESVAALQDFDLEIPSSQMVVMLGPSGCGKSTALNAIAGLLEPEQGQITIDGRATFDAAAHTNVPPDRRGIGMVFQSYALWPHMTVAENVNYPLRTRGIRGADAQAAVGRSLDMVRARRFADRYPSELSGGQQQRISLARAIVAEPKVILFDEPLSNLDAGLRQELRETLAELHERLGFTGLYVTHDQAEALALGDVVAVMRAGVIEQLGDPQAVFNRPASPYVADFLGANVISGVVSLGEGSSVKTAFGQFILASAQAITNGEVEIAFHPHLARLELSVDPQAPTVSLARYGGPRWEYTIAGADGARLKITRPQGEPRLDVGARVNILVDPKDLLVYPSS